MVERVCAIVSEDIITNMVIVDDEKEFKVKAGETLIPMPDDVVWGTGMVRNEEGDFVNPPKPTEEVRQELMADFAGYVQTTEIRIVGRVPKSLKVSIVASIEAITHEDQREQIARDFTDQLDALTVQDGE